MQIESARIVLGVTRSISLNTLCKEIGWLTLDDRRTFVLTFKIKTNLVPDLFSRSAENPHYNLRQQNDFLTLPNRTSLFERSFVPSATQR